MTTSSPTLQTCPSWCRTKECRGDHFSNPGSDTWPGVVATGWPEQRGPLLSPAPTWGESDGLIPGVVICVEGGDRDYDVSVDLRPHEARALAMRLVKAADVAEEDVCVAQSLATPTAVQMCTRHLSLFGLAIATEMDIPFTHESPEAALERYAARCARSDGCKW